MSKTQYANLEAFWAEAASYFERRPTGGEDMAHWSNVYNAMNCRATAAVIAAQTAKIRILEEALSQPSDA